MLLKRLLFAAFIAVLAVLAIFNTISIAIANTLTSKDYMLKLSAKNVKPNSEVQIMIRSAKPGEILFMIIVDEGGEPVNITVFKVYKGTIVQAGHLIIVKTDEIDAQAIFCIKAPSKPGTYIVKLYDPIGEVELEERIIVEWTIQQLFKKPGILIIGLIILTIAIVTAYLFLLAPA